jgi:hypothetical protein
MSVLVFGPHVGTPIRPQSYTEIHLRRYLAFSYRQPLFVGSVSDSDKMERERESERTNVKFLAINGNIFS